MRAVGPLLLASVAAVASCNSGVQADPGTDAYMQVHGAQFIRGAMPDGSASGPAVAQLVLIDNDIWPGLQDFPVGGALTPTATAAAIGLQGDKGYWMVVAGPAAVATPTDPSFGANASFSTGIVPGGYTLVARAVDGNGNFGPPVKQVLTGVPSPTTPPPSGQLVVTLTWDRDANLDLHVVDPNGVEIYWNNQSSQPPPPAMSVDGGPYGYVDDDSNANCVIDGLNREDAIWPNHVPSGPYTVRVDTASLCGQAVADWNLRVLLHGKQVAQSSGVSTDAATRGSHGTGAGVLALQFTVP
ncbi:MAG TPA: hypothetical protein VF765_17685 [Polyangiaceae bacterium]